MALLSDINMLVITGGQERTNAEYGDLLASAGLIIGKVHPAAFPYGLIEGFPAWPGPELPPTSPRQRPRGWDGTVSVVTSGGRGIGRVPAQALAGAVARGLRQGWIAALQNDPLFARWFAHAYAGVDPD